MSWVRLKWQIWVWSYFEAVVSQTLLVSLDEVSAVLLSILNYALVPQLLSLWACTTWLQLLFLTARVERERERERECLYTYGWAFMCMWCVAYDSISSQSILLDLQQTQHATEGWYDHSCTTILVHAGKQQDPCLCIFIGILNTLHLNEALNLPLFSSRCLRGSCLRATGHLYSWNCLQQRTWVRE